MPIALSRNDIFARFDARSDLRPVDLPDGSQVMLRPLSGAGADTFAATSQKNPELARATLVVACVCDLEGKPLFVQGDVDRVAQLPNRFLAPIVEAIIDHNGLRPEVAAAAVPTSEDGPTSEPGSALPATSEAPSPS